jgi:hypothetical protein
MHGLVTPIGNSNWTTMPGAIWVKFSLFHRAQMSSVTVCDRSCTERRSSQTVSEEFAQCDGNL